jgi:F-type H+-transporting ATPase subunit epsilon
MADKINLEVITPERLVLREAVDEVIIPALNGELGILPNHTPLISQLRTGILTYRQGNERKQLHVSGGFVEIQAESVAILSDVAEKAEEIDLERARRAREVAEKKLAAKGDDPDFLSAEEKLERALTRLQLAGQGKRK